MCTSKLPVCSGTSLTMTALEIHPMLKPALHSTPSPHLRFISLVHLSGTSQQGAGGLTGLMHLTKLGSTQSTALPLGSASAPHPHLRSLANHRAGWAGRAQCLCNISRADFAFTSPRPWLRTPGPEYLGFQSASWRGPFLGLQEPQRFPDPDEGFLVLPLLSSHRRLLCG